MTLFMEKPWETGRRTKSLVIRHDIVAGKLHKIAKVANNLGQIYRTSLSKPGFKLLKLHENLLFFRA